jgi:conjugative transfer region protein TrbK
VDTKLFARVAAIGLAAVAITLAVIQMREPSTPPPDPLAIDTAAAPADPLRAELRRCQSIGVDAASDRNCLRAWAENRRRFLAPGARPRERLDAPEATRPTAPDEAQVAPCEDSPPEDQPIVKSQEPVAAAVD